MWRGLEQSLIDDAVDQWPTCLRACVRTNGGHLNIPYDCQFDFSILDELGSTEMVQVTPLRRTLASSP